VPIRSKKCKVDELRLASTLKLVCSLHSVEQGVLREFPRSLDLPFTFPHAGFRRDRRRNFLYLRFPQTRTVRRSLINVLQT
jgi:hypothetical protein